VVVVIVVVVLVATTKDQCNPAEQTGTWSWGSRAHSTYQCMTKLTVMPQ